LIYSQKWLEIEKQNRLTPMRTNNIEILDHL
jgi:hypothetical protein